MAEILFFIIGLFLVSRILRAQNLHLGDVLARTPAASGELPSPDAAAGLTPGESEPVLFSIETLTDSGSRRSVQPRVGGTRLVPGAGGARVLTPYGTDTAPTAGSGSRGTTRSRILLRMRR